ncbi:uncharacterized protein FA14DRAFT_152868 [Meira miltonrushii]|uniref:Uncharacterized protein n=1 Tax=Meira miltonrushii TaxID=1280837 RepID=A0A316VIK1_9BASI|nr:uncharacterized protein FA14DRAFT_152868 [Meira miltonrushii]PWN37487.1 hypothetical protein FA14DRAFT_152868 [Meira miltonrushii]
MSSDSSSDILSDNEEVSQQSPKDIPARSRHGEKKAFKPPSGYQSASFSDDLLETFANDAVSKKSGKQVWCIKLPDGISPAQLDGLSIGLPSEQDPNTPLAHLVIERAGRGDSNKSYQQKYLLQNRKTASKHDQTKQQDSKTQLIAMAGGNAGLEKDEDNSNDNLANEEMESLHVMLPNRKSDGQYVLAPVKVSQYMQLVIETPVQSNDMTGSTDADPKKIAKDLNTNKQTTAISAGAKRQRTQPWDKLKGFFNPAGSRTLDEEVDDSDEKKVKKAKVEQNLETGASSSPKKSKKSKKSST